MGKAILLSLAFSLEAIRGGQWLAGKASWYQPKPAHVRAYGTKLLAASNQFRPGTRLLVQYRNKSVTVIVCGRGPFVRGRQLDLSLAAFRRLELPSRGVIKVQYKNLRERDHHCAK